MDEYRSDKATARFWAKVRVTQACWLWTGAKKANGYGNVKIAGKNLHPHRVSWDLLVGDIPNGMVLDHICHVRLCVNPDHLRVVTQKQNLENRRGLSHCNKSGARGVFRLGPNRWRASVGHNNAIIQLGVYATLEEASKVARAARNRLFTHNDLDR